MKKRVLAIIMAAVMVMGALTACGGSSSGNGAKDTQASTTGSNETNKKTEDTQSGDSDLASSDTGSEEQGNAGAAGDIKTGGVVKLGTPAVVVNLGYPGKLSTFIELSFAQPAVEPLCRYTKEGELTPWLCDSYDLDADTLTLTVKLKEGILFHDGTPFNAEAVKWNWEEFSAQGRSEITVIESIECPDEYTVVAHLSTWDNTIADNALYQAGFMFSPTYGKENGVDAANSHPVGTGPFVFKEWQKDVKLVYEKNDNYRIKGQPYLDGIEIEFIGDANTLTTAYQAGEIDAMIMITSDVLTIMEATGETALTAEGLTGGAAISMVAFGCTDDNSPCKDLLVRQAFCHAVDWETLCTASGGLYYTNQWAVPGSWSYNEETIGYPYDVEKAKKLLAQAGYPDGVEINCYTLENNSTQATMLQQFVAEAGITLNIQSIDQARQDEMSGLNGNWDGIMLSAGRADVEIASIYGRSFTDEGVRYVGGFLHPDDLVKLITDAKAAKTQDERAAYCKQMAKMIIDDYCMVAPIGIAASNYYERDYIKDLGINQTHLVLWTPEQCWLDK